MFREMSRPVHEKDPSSKISLRVGSRAAAKAKFPIVAFSFHWCDSRNCRRINMHRPCSVNTLKIYRPRPSLGKGRIKSCEHA